MDKNTRRDEMNRQYNDNRKMSGEQRRKPTSVKKKRSKAGSFIISFITSVLITCLMLSAVGFGAYLGYKYVKPHSEQIVNNFQIDTLEYTSIDTEKCNILIVSILR